MDMKTHSSSISSSSARQLGATERIQCAGKFVDFKRGTLALVVIAFWLSAPGQLEANNPSRRHEMSGTVQRVDRKTITIIPRGESQAVVFDWDRDTRFVYNGSPATVDGLR